MTVKKLILHLQRYNENLEVNYLDIGNMPVEISKLYLLDKHEDDDKRNYQILVIS